MINEHPLQDRLVAALGDQLPAAWRPAFTATPRHLFLPNRIQLTADPATMVDRRTDPAGWLRTIYTDEAIVTQLYDGGEPGENAYPISSSSSMPSVMAHMLDLLDVHDGDRVLELGTGTGWNAALLAARLGDENVTTVETDRALAGAARTALAGAGHGGVQVVVGDGADGYEPGAPYDRVISTFAVDQVPYRWVQQTRPGGVIVTPWGPAYDNSALVRLTVGEDGTAAGRIVGWASFMIRRQQRAVVGSEPADFDLRADRLPYDEATPDDVDYTELIANDDAVMGVGLGLPRVRRWLDTTDDGTITGLWLLADDAWAHIADGEVRQAGARRLWDETTAAYQRWTATGRPTRDDWQITIGRHGQIVTATNRRSDHQDTR